MKYNNSGIPSPCYVIDEVALRRNLSLIRGVAERSGAEVILALKAFAGWGVFPIMKEYVRYATASSLNEARLAYEEMGTPVHAYAPVYTDSDFPEILSRSSHITFNSCAQYERFKEQALGKVSCGLRINPEYSVVETDLYNPASPASRLGIPVSKLPGDKLPEGIEGLHFHTLCESNSFQLEKTLQAVEEKFGKFLPQVKWLNMGGGHLMTRVGYDTEHLIGLLKDFRKRYPHIKLILEPGSAFTWDTGCLVSTVEDIVDNGGVKTAILDVSFACHMPDCLEMPYKPRIEGASEPKIKYEVESEPEQKDGVTTNTSSSSLASPAPAVSASPISHNIERHVYRMGGNCCLAGDFYGDWAFDHELQVGERIIFRDMIHYTMVKTTTFNGVAHPSIGIVGKDGNFRLIRKFGYEDFKSKLS